MHCTTITVAYTYVKNSCIHTRPPTCFDSLRDHLQEGKYKGFNMCTRLAATRGKYFIFYHFYYFLFYKIIKTEQVIVYTQQFLMFVPNYLTF